MSFEVPGDCFGKACGFGAFGGEIGCDTGSGSCWSAIMVSADTSSFHDEVLQKATKQIQEILEQIGEDPKGRKLSFVHSTHGTMLAWVNHGVTFPQGTITIDNDPDEVAKALGIRVEQPPKAS